MNPKLKEKFEKMKRQHKCKNTLSARSKTLYTSPDSKTHYAYIRNKVLKIGMQVLITKYLQKLIYQIMFFTLSYLTIS